VTEPTGLVVLGHGAGGGVEAPDLLAVTAALVGAGWSVARVEQPYRVAGKRAPVPAPRLDEAFSAVVVSLLLAIPASRLVLGGRSSGARVACRTATSAGAHGVLALAFPLCPPSRPERSRADELAAAGVPVLVVQGDHDPFGGPADFPAGRPAGVRIVGVPGDHSLRRSAGELGRLVTEWLAGIARDGAALDSP
jgi:predicted alpha/beta-hydrolase family hydrolase